MYGEKAEEAEELKLDLLDVKAMYRSQVTISTAKCIADVRLFCAKQNLIAMLIMATY